VPDAKPEKLEVDANQLLENALRDGIRNGVLDKLKGYNSPLDKMLAQALDKHQGALTDLMGDTIGSLINNQEFRDELATAARHALAKQLIHKLGGELEKQINALKSNPTTRARIVLAIDEIVKTAQTT